MAEASTSTKRSRKQAHPKKAEKEEENNEERENQNQPERKEEGPAAKPKSLCEKCKKELQTRRKTAVGCGQLKQYYVPENYIVCNHGSGGEND